MAEKKLGIIKKIKTDEELNQSWGRLSPAKQKILMDIDSGVRVPYLLGDTMFKRLFDPDREKERLSSLISSILGREVTVLHSLKNEGIQRSEKSKKIILDIAVQFADGSLANVEIQRYGIHFPSKRAVVYSADMVARQYATLDGIKKSDIDYESVKPVYFIIILEKCMPEFRDFPDYCHHFEQQSDTGAALELLQYYDFICLDKFKEQKPRIGGELEKWLNFLSITDVADMLRFLDKNSSFQKIYDSAILMLNNKEELMNMMNDIFAAEDIVASLQLSYETMGKNKDREIAGLKIENSGLKTENSGLKSENSGLKNENSGLKSKLAEQDKKLAERDEKLTEQNEKLAEQDEKIATMEKELAMLKHKK